MTLAERLLEINAKLDAARIGHAFGGAIALAYWTLDPRGTNDLDVNVFTPPESCRATLSALPSGISSGERDVNRIIRDGQVRLWWDRTPVDLFFDNLPIHGEAARHRRLVPFEGCQIPILGPIELGVFKAMFSRTKDWADIEAMLSARTLDAEALRAHLVELVGPEDQRLARLEEAIRRGQSAS